MSSRAERPRCGLRMRADCIPETLRTVLNLVRRVSDDDWVAAKTLNKIMAEMPRIGLDQSPAEYAFAALRRAEKLTGANDLFAEEKACQNAAALAAAGALEEHIAKAKDPLRAAARLALAANQGDRPLPEEELAEHLLTEAEASPAIDHYADFRKAARSAKTVLYVLDNCGEIVLDKLLMNQMRGKKIRAVVRYAPILNDATRADAEAASVAEAAQIVDPGADMLGVVLPLASDAFRKLFAEADLVLCKGQACLETLWGVGREIFFLLEARGPVVPGHLGVPVGSSVLHHYAPPAEPGTHAEVRVKDKG